MSPPNPLRGPNLFDTVAPATGERFETLARISGVHIERITSSLCPDTSPYDQPQDEWVALLSGEATIELAGIRCTLRAGDTLLIPSHTPHRVLATSEGAIWLAVHVH